MPHNFLFVLLLFAGSFFWCWEVFYRTEDKARVEFLDPSSYEGQVSSGSCCSWKSVLVIGSPTQPKDKKSVRAVYREKR